MKNVRTLVVIALVLAMVVVGVAGCSSTPPKPKGGKDAGGTLTYRFKLGMTHIHPQETNRQHVTEGTQYMYEGLFARDDKGKVVPRLVKDYTVSSDGLTYVFNLQPGVKFHDGSTFDAEVVKWNFEEYVKDKFALYTMLDGISYEVTGPLQITFKLQAPKAHLLSLLTLGTFYMMSKTAVELHGQDWFHTNAIGTGPYTLVEFKQNDILKVKKNPNYWQKGLPYLDEIVIKMMADADAAAMMLEAGDLDVCLEINATDAKRYAANPALGIDVVSGIGTSQLNIILNNRVKPLNDRRVRQAFNYAVDKQAIVKTVFGGIGATVPTCPVLTPAIEGYVNTGTYPYDPVKAGQLLDEAGWVLNAQTKVREKNGERMELTLWCQKVYGEFELAEVVQSSLIKIGVTVNLIVTDPGYWHEQTTVPPEKAKYQMMVRGWGTYTADAEYTINNLWRGDIMPMVNRNRAFYNNPKVNELIIQGNSLPLAERNVKYAEALRLIHEDAPHIFCVDYTNQAGVRDYVKGLVPYCGEGQTNMAFCWFEYE